MRNFLRGSIANAKKEHANIGGKLFDIANTLFMYVLIVMMVYPLWYILIYSISDSTEAAKGIFLLPRGITFINYKNILVQTKIYSAALISVSRTVVGTIITLICSSMFAYALTKDILPGKKLMYRMLIMTMYIQAGLIPWYMLMRGLGLQNTFLLYVLPSAIGAFYVIIIKTYIEDLPEAVEESAYIDGAGPFQIYWYIVMPLSVPVLATIGVFSGVYQWNNWADNMFLNTKAELQTLQLMLYRYLMANQANVESMMNELDTEKYIKKISPMAIRMTITMIVTLPVLMIYPLCQKYFIRGLLIGSIKG
jgi:putative aldouronate transport system permease protein